MANLVAATKGNLMAAKKSYDLSKLGFELLERKNKIDLLENNDSDDTDDDTDDDAD